MTVGFVRRLHEVPPRVFDVVGVGGRRARVVDEVAEEPGLDGQRRVRFEAKDGVRPRGTAVEHGVVGFGFGVRLGSPDGRRRAVVVPRRPQRHLVRGWVERDDLVRFQVPRGEHAEAVAHRAGSLADGIDVDVKVRKEVWDLAERLEVPRHRRDQTRLVPIVQPHLRDPARREHPLGDVATLWHELVRAGFRRLGASRGRRRRLNGGRGLLHRAERARTPGCAARRHERRHGIVNDICRSTDGPMTGGFVLCRFHDASARESKVIESVRSVSLFQDVYNYALLGVRDGSRVARRRRRATRASLLLLRPIHPSIRRFAETPSIPFHSPRPSRNPSPLVITRACRLRYRSARAAP